MMCPPRSSTFIVSATAPNATVANTTLNTVLASSPSPCDRHTPNSRTKTSGPHRSHSRIGRVGSRATRMGFRTSSVLDATRSTSRLSVRHTDSSRVFQSRSSRAPARPPSRTSAAEKSRSTSSLNVPPPPPLEGAAWPKLPLLIVRSEVRGWSARGERLDSRSGRA
eukprot:31071-Pelagococcus_subviridis.AAC.3